MTIISLYIALNIFNCMSKCNITFLCALYINISYMPFNILIMIKEKKKKQNKTFLWYYININISTASRETLSF